MMEKNDYNLFQFLIGAMKVHHIHLKSGPTHVSIPYRRNESLFHMKDLLPLYSFNSL